MQEQLNVNFVTRVQLIDKVTGDVYVDKCNAVHPQNMATIIARGLAHENNSWIHKVYLGNGGTHISTSGQISYLTPNTTGNASLYNKTYEEQIDDASTGTPTTNSVKSEVLPAPKTSAMVVATVEIDTSEPNGQAVTDTSNTTTNYNYAFDELALYSKDNLLLTHIVFEPIPKSANRGLLLIYSLEVRVS